MAHHTLYLIPSTLGEYNFPNIFPPSIKGIVESLDVFIVENVRTTRRMFSALQIEKPIDSLRFYELNKHTTLEDKLKMAMLLNESHVGLLSEAGVPCMADPGNEIVSLIHEMGHKVEPLVGPSSVLLALMASGFNGQSFTFHGYLPIDKNERARDIRKMEQEVLKSGYTQIFMETPYRNVKLFEELLLVCNDKTRLGLAVNITLPDAFHRSGSIANWKKTKKPDIHKKPAIFLLY